MLWTLLWPVFRLRQTTRGRENGPATRIHMFLSKNGYIKKGKGKEVHLFLSSVLQVASSCRLQCLGFCVPNLVEQGIYPRPCLCTQIESCWMAKLCPLKIFLAASQREECSSAYFSPEQDQGKVFTHNAWDWRIPLEIIYSNYHAQSRVD